MPEAAGGSNTLVTGMRPHPEVWNDLEQAHHDQNVDDAQHVPQGGDAGRFMSATHKPHARDNSS